MSEVVVPSYVAVFIYIHYIHTCARESWVFVRCYCAVLWCVQIIKYILTRRSYSLPHYHQYADLSESELLKWLSGTFCLECVSKIEPILSIIFHAIYEAVRIQVTHFSYDDYENVCTLSYNLHQIGSMTHLPLFRVRSWNNDVRRPPPPWKWSPFRRLQFQMRFNEWKVLYFDSNFTEVCPRGSNWQKFSIGTWTNDAPVHRRIYAALKEDWLMLFWLPHAENPLLYVPQMLLSSIVNVFIALPLAPCFIVTDYWYGYNHIALADLYFDLFHTLDDIMYVFYC